MGEESCNAMQFDTFSLLPQAASIHHHISKKSFPHFIFVQLKTVPQTLKFLQFGAEFHFNLVVFLQFGPNLE